MSNRFSTKNGAEQFSVAILAQAIGFCLQLCFVSSSVSFVSAKMGMSEDAAKMGMSEDACSEDVHSWLVADSGVGHFCYAGALAG